jgi:phage portal protein BeeE
VRLIAESIGALSFVLYEGTAERDSHPLLDLMKRPNPRQDGASLLEAAASHLLLAGNAYIEAVGLDGEGEARVRQLYAHLFQQSNQEQTLGAGRFIAEAWSCTAQANGT